MLLLLGSGLTSYQIEEGNAFLSWHRPYFIIVAAQLRTKNSEYFPHHMFSEDIINGCTPETWWKSLQPNERLSEDAINFASKLMILPAGSADIERHFSILGNIMGVRRTRLGIDKAAKLCKIYKHLAGKNAPGDDGGDWDNLDLE